MEQPLGRTVGNALEVAESIACLRGDGPADVMEVTYTLGAHMLLLGGVAASEDEARGKLKAAITNGAALGKFREIVSAQGGDAKVIDHPARLPRAKENLPLLASRGGVVHEVDAMKVALAALRLGAGRARAEDTVDLAVGVSGLLKIGERVAKGDALCVIHANDAAALGEAREGLENAIVIGAEAVDAPVLIGEVL
jgi:thymidine phosphorylase